MISRVLRLFSIARKLSISGAVETVNQIYKLPLTINIFFNLISLGSNKKNLNIENIDNNKHDAKRSLKSKYITLVMAMTQPRAWPKTGPAIRPLRSAGG